MQLKDYYSILELAPSATRDEIKKAYRRLAQVYHPDKDIGNLESPAHFQSIREAYETLMDPGKKHQYLQNRWYAKTMNQKMDASGPLTAVSLLKKLLEFEQHVRLLDPHRMDKVQIGNYLLELDSAENVKIANSYPEESVHKEIVFTSVRIAERLHYDHVKLLASNLELFDNLDPTTKKAIKNLCSVHEQRQYWEKRKIWIVLAILAIICSVIYFAGRSGTSSG